MVKYALIIFLLDPTTAEVKEYRYPMSSAEECFQQVAKIAVGISGKAAYFQTACIRETEPEAESEDTLDI